MTNVVKFKKPASKRKGSKAKRPTASKDERLINECVIFAQSVAANDAGYDADPDGNNEYATRAGARHSARAAAALAYISETPATTAEALQAKARIIPAVIKDAAHSMDEREEAFFLSFGADVKDYLQHIIDANWKAAAEAKRDGNTARTDTALSAL